MAKFTTSGFITSIRGKLGDSVFYSWRGVPGIRVKAKKIKNPRTPLQQKTRRNFAMFTKIWNELTRIEKALWEEFAKQFKHRKGTSSRSLIPHTQKGIMTGQNAFLSVNMTLVLSGFTPIRKPTLNTPNPPLLSHDLPLHPEFRDGVIKFKIWLPHQHREKCNAQIWMKVAKAKEYGYLARVIPISTTPTEVIFSTVRIHDKRRKVVDFPIKKLGKRDVLLQVRTIAENGKVSLPGAIYRLELLNSNSKSKLLPSENQKWWHSVSP